MRDTALNAPARRLLTGFTILVLSMAILAAATLVAVAGDSPSPRAPRRDRPAFTRRTATLPAIVVTAPGAAELPATVAR